MSAVFGTLGAIGVLWWAVFALKPYEIADTDLRALYTHESVAAEKTALTLTSVESERGVAFDLKFRAADGAEVNGRIVYPSDPKMASKPFPLVIGLHGLGRTHVRWWQSELRGRPTLESTHLVTSLALDRGYAVVALDARRHGARRDPDTKPSDLLWDMKIWGKREPYEQMIVETVKEYRQLIDALSVNPTLDTKNLRAAGYSMGAQMAMLLAAHDERIKSVAAMVPPHLDDKVARVSPRRSVSGLVGKQVWLLSADEDEYASKDQNATLFDTLPTSDKKHIRFTSGHALPPNYVEALRDWL
jgi:pimeloyl-ACP methyl ester carboxylesterase